MFDLIRAHPRKALWVLGIPALVMTVYLLHAVHYSLNYNNGATGALLDDTWIHVRFAQSISEGRGLMYNDGVVTSGATSPLWVMLLAGVFVGVQPDIAQQVAIAILMSAISGVFAVIAVSGFAWYVLRVAWVGLLAGLLTAFTGRFLWQALSGMETTLFAALSIVALWAHVADVRQNRTFGWRTGILTACATLARPEGYLLAVLIGGTAFVLIPLIHKNIGLSLGRWWKAIRDGWRGCVAYIILAGSYPIACLLMDGHLLPNTFRVKSQLGLSRPDLLYGYFWTPRMDHGGLMILLAGVGALALLWRVYRPKDDRSALSYAAVLWPIVFVVGVLYLGPGHYVINHGRYVSPAIPFHALLVSVGVWASLNLVFSKKQAFLTPAIVVAVIGLSAFVGARGYWNVHQVANDVYQLRAMHVELGKWLKEVAEPDDLIALNDVGAITHVSDLPILDLMGLVSPEMIEPLSREVRMTCPYDVEVMRVLRDAQPRFIVIFPWWYPCMAYVGEQGFPDILQAYNVFSITGTTVIAGGEMVVYWPIWERWPVQQAIPDDVMSLEVEFEQGIHLSGYKSALIPDGLSLDLWWTVTSQPEGDYTVFVHVLDETGDIIAQQDSRPREGKFNTAWWRDGDIIPDWRFIPLSADVIDEAVMVRIGLYPTGGGERLLRSPAPMDEPDYVIFSLTMP